MITQAMYESREQFMLESLALSDEIQAFMRDNGIRGGGRGFGRGGGGMPRTPEERIAAAARAVEQAYRALNGGEVRPGTLYPPTQAQREQLRSARELFEQVRRERGR